MATVLVGVISVIGTLLGVVIGIIGQEYLARRNRQAQVEELLVTEARRVYAEFLRAISASYVQAVAGERTRTEDNSLRAAAAEIQLLSGKALSEPVQALVEQIIAKHSQIAADPSLASAVAEEMNSGRIAIIDLFKADLDRRQSELMRTRQIRGQRQLQ